MIKLIQLKEILRNKRFIFFTIIIPGMWFILMKNIFSDASVNKINFNYIWFIMAILIGILGNSIVTLGKRISNSKKFYILQFKISRYSIWNFMLDSLIIQIILNLLIISTVTLIAIIMGAISIDLKLLFFILFLSIFGIYISIIGFSIGISLNQRILDSGGAPIMILISFLFIPFYTFINGNFVNIITTIQKIFPGYYLIKIINQLVTNDNVGLDPLLLLISSLITSIPFIFLIWHNLIKK